MKRIGVSRAAAVAVLCVGLALGSPAGVQKSPSPGGGAFAGLFGVATVSANDAWSVGSYFRGSNDNTWVERWDGKAWFG